MVSSLHHTITKKFKAFSKHSTLHGFYYFYKSNSWTTNLVWSCILVASCVLCAFLGDMIWKKYIIDPTFTVVESTRYSMSKIGFPAVALCDTEHVYGPNTGNITRILQRRGFNKEQIEKFYNSIDAVKNEQYISPPYVIKMHTLLDDLGISYIDLIDILKKSCDHLLVSCVWRSKTLNCQQMFKEVFTVFGFCCQFDMKYFRSQVKGNNLTFIPGTEITEALQVIVDDQVITANGTKSNGFIRLYVFDENEKLTLLNNHVTLSASTFYDVRVDVWVIDSSEHVESLPIDSRKCLMSTDSSIVGADFYSGCISMVIVKKVVDHCRCLPFNFTAADLLTEDYKECSWELLPCVYRTINQQMADINRITSENQCYESCNYVQYDMNINYYKETNSKNKTFSRFAVHFTEETCLKYRKQVLYSWDQMLANLGGIFGLCVGGSIISVVELLGFITDVLFTIAVSCSKKKNVTKKKKISNFKVFTTSSSPMKLNMKTRKLAFMN